MITLYFIVFNNYIIIVYYIMKISKFKSLNADEWICLYVTSVVANGGENISSI